MIELQVEGAPGDALLGCVSVLRRLGGRIIRYDIEAQTLEARWRGRGGGATTVRLSAGADANGGSRLRIEEERFGWWRRRRLRAALGRLAMHPATGGDDQR